MIRMIGAIVGVTAAIVAAVALPTTTSVKEPGSGLRLMAVSHQMVGATQVVVAPTGSRIIDCSVPHSCSVPPNKRFNKKDLRDCAAQGGIWGVAGGAGGPEGIPAGAAAGCTGAVYGNHSDDLSPLDGGKTAKERWKDEELSKKEA